MKTFYLWDLADTLFEHNWDPKIGGFTTFNDYLKSKGLVREKLSQFEFEQANVEPLRKGLFGGLPLDGFKEVLELTKNNFIFTTGNKEQVDARAYYLLPKIGFDIRNFFQGIYSTFDFGSTNLKTAEMFKSIVADAKVKGFERIVYTDNDPRLRGLFEDAIKQVPGIESKSFSNLQEVTKSEFNA